MTFLDPPPQLHEVKWTRITDGRPPLDPDPLYVESIETEALYQAGWDDGFERALAVSLPRIRIIALAAFTGLLLGIILTVSALERLS